MQLSYINLTRYDVAYKAPYRMYESCMPSAALANTIIIEILECRDSH